MRNSDWMHVRIGDVVRERDGRHAGRITGILNSSFVNVRWDNGWRSEDLPIDDVERWRDQ